MAVTTNVIPKEILPAMLDHLMQGLPVLLPEYILVASLLLSCLFQLGNGKIASMLTYGSVAIGLFGSLICGWNTVYPTNETLYFFDHLRIDPIGRKAAMLADLSGLLFLACLRPALIWPKSSISFRNDLYTLLPGILLGIHIMSLSTHWLTALVALEMVSLGSYMYVAYLKNQRFIAEAGLKYILFGSTCSALMIYGLSWIYGLTGTLSFTDPLYQQGLSQADPALVLLAHLLVLVGIGFKMAIFPFHWWSPDILQGAPTPIAAFLATAPKIGGFLLLFRMLDPMPLDGNYAHRLWMLLAAWAVLTLLVGNISALRQKHVKRLMAYSSIGHGGFLLMAILAQRNLDSSQTFLYYLLLYILTTFGMFVWIGYIEQKHKAITLLDYKGLGAFSPGAFVAWIILLLSMIGLPPSGGFLAKVLVFSAGIDSYQASGQWMWLLMLVTAAICTVIALFYYLAIARNAFLLKSDLLNSPIPSKESKGLYVMGWILALISLGLGIFPSLLA
jgi:NADH-quinone oxidoreductase subunit N